MANEAKNQKAEGNAPGTPETTTHSEAILSAVDATIAKTLKGRRHGWSQSVHNDFLTRLARSCGMPLESCRRFYDLLAWKGAGGNASQFRQWLESKPTAKAPNAPNRLDEAPSIAAVGWQE